MGVNQKNCSCEVIFKILFRKQNIFEKGEATKCCNLILLCVNKKKRKEEKEKTISKAIKGLFKKESDEKEIIDQLKESHGNLALAIEQWITQKMNPQQTRPSQFDQLYKQRIEEIDQTVDLLQKSDKICWYACSYAYDKKAHLFVSILEKYNSQRQVIWDREFNFKRFWVSIFFFFFFFFKKKMF
ncbi:hypothetical protein RFI_06681 [Reticulomyxa filosa]|uniref:Uncharacterized protein n=1 Tax=Reticulomyxa filosa TaxID=46433 RepID=X6NX91_RETFI|nr:hypothetical protein RFI_06681 [Reticulomyxa filosa]|eukprot:ETO30439.1 hypothetical protein RFI_06681 [Reticulomyxa filosa]